MTFEGMTLEVSSFWSPPCSCWPCTSRAGVVGAIVTGSPQSTVETETGVPEGRVDLWEKVYVY